MAAKRKKRRKLKNGPGVMRAIRAYQKLHAGERGYSEQQVLRNLKAGKLKFVNGKIISNGEPTKKERGREKLRELIFSELEKMLFPMVLKLAPIVADIIKEAALESKRTADYVIDDERMSHYKLKYATKMAEMRNKLFSK